MSEPVFRKRFGEEEAWGREYSRNRYLRFETRVDVNQRYQDLMKNITILTDTDKVDVTGEKHCNRPLEYAGFYLSKQSGAVQPAHVLRSSKDRYQILWDTVPGEWDMEGAEVVMRALAERYGGDRAATDVARVMRMPGFRNKKPGRSGALVTWAWHGGPLVRPEDFPGLTVSEQERAGRSGGRRKMPPGHHSQSERDWAAAGDALRNGEAPETVISRLEQQRQDKPNPGYYARRTVRRKAEELKRGLPR